MQKHPKISFYQITAPHFCAGLTTFRRGQDLNAPVTVDSAAPIIRYMLGWDVRRLFDYCRSKGWEIKVVEAAQK